MNKDDTQYVAFGGCFRPLNKLGVDLHLLVSIDDVTFDSIENWDKFFNDMLPVIKKGLVENYTKFKENHA